MMKNLTVSVDKIDVEELTKDYKVTNADTFAVYLKEVWRVITNINN
jgi:hypothetical protein